MTLANKLPIKSFRVAKGYTQQEVAEKLVYLGIHI